MSFNVALGKYALAAKKSHPDKLAKTRDAATHPAIAPGVASATATTSNGPLVACVPILLNQGYCSGCTWHAFTAGLATRCTCAKQPPTFLGSQKGGYAYTRAIERASVTPPGQALPTLTDSGAELADVVVGAGTFGVSPYQGPSPDGRNSDVWTAQDVEGMTNAPLPNVNDEPDGQQLETAASDPLSGAYTIDLTASNAVQVGVAALATGFPLYVGAFVDSAFMSLQFGQIAQAPNQNDPNGGGHAIFLIDRRPSTAVPGTTEFLLRNSWGPWAGALASNDGMVWVSQAWYLACWEIWILDEALVATQKAVA